MGAESNHNVSHLPWLRQEKNAVLVVLIGILAVGMIVTAYFSIKDEYVPTNRTVVVKNTTYIDVVIEYEKNILVPVENFLNHKTSLVSTAFFFTHPNTTVPVYIKGVELSSNTSNPTLTFSSGIASSAIKFQNGQFANQTFYNTVEVGHPLHVKNSTETYNLYVFYRLFKNTGMPLHEVIIPLTWTIETLDFSEPSYFWIIFIGVLVSRIFSFSPDFKSVSTNLSRRELLWVPFSAIITLLIFASFREQTKLTTDVMTNLALAFGFGFGFDKVLGSWQNK